MSKPKMPRKTRDGELFGAEARRFREACMAVRQSENTKLTRLMNAIETAARGLGAEFDIGAGEFEFVCSCGALICISARDGTVQQRRGGHRCESFASIKTFIRKTLEPLERTENES
jgi:hypothetical protein